MKDLGVLIAVGAGIYILSQRNKEDDSKKLDDNVPDIGGSDPSDPNSGDDSGLRAVTVGELTSGEISAAEASQVYVTSEEIEIIKDIFELELDLNDLVKEVLTNKQNYIEGTPTSLINDIKNYTNEFEGCINSGYSALNTITPGKALSTQVINIFNEVGQCAIKVREEVQYLAGEDGELIAYITPEGYSLIESGSQQILTDFINTYGGLPEPLGEPSYEN